MTSTTTYTARPPIILIAGHWLGAWAWDEVLEHIRGERLEAVAITLPGLDPLDDHRETATLEDQARAILALLLQHDGQPAVLVAHSGANAPVSLVLDRHPELVAHVVWVDSGPVADGSVFAPDSPAELTSLPLPPLDVLAEQASLDGLSEEALARFRDRAVPQPGATMRDAVILRSEARHRVPTTLICCSITAEQVAALADREHPMFAEIAKLACVEFIDLPTGHWPMWSRPRELAEAIARAASRSQPASQRARTAGRIAP